MKLVQEKLFASAQQQKKKKKNGTERKRIKHTSDVIDPKKSSNQP